MNTLFKILRSNDTLYWLYAKTLYNGQRYLNDVFEASQILENLWLGGISSVCNRESLQKRNIDLIITAVLGSSATYPYDFKYDRSKLKDIEDEDILPEIERLVPRIHEELSENKGVLVSCIKGRSRSCTIVAGYLIRHHNMSAEQALAFIKEKRTQVDPNPSYIKALHIYELKVRKQREQREEKNDEEIEFEFEINDDENE